MSDRTEPQDSYRWMVLFLAYLCLLVFGFALQSLPPVLSLAIADLGLTHAQAGALMSFFSLPGVLLAIPAGSFSDRWGAGSVGRLSLLATLAGTIVFGLSRVFVVASLARLVAGAGAVITTVVAAQMLAHWFRGGGLGFAMGVYTTAMPLGTVLCFNAFGRVGERFGWRAPVGVVVVLTAVTLAAFGLLYKDPPRDSTVRCDPDPQQTGPFSHIVSVGPAIWVLGFSWMAFNAAVISFSTFAPDFLVLRGYSIGAAGSLVSLLMWGALILNPLVGRLVDTADRNEVFIGAGTAAVAAATYALARDSTFLAPMIVLAVAVGLVPAAVFSLPGKILPAGCVGLAYGVLGTASSTGMVLGPYVSGKAKDVSGSYAAVFLLLCGFSLCALIGAVVARVLRQRA